MNNFICQEIRAKTYLMNKGAGGEPGRASFEKTGPTCFVCIFWSLGHQKSRIYYNNIRRRCLPKFSATSLDSNSTSYVVVVAATPPQKSVIRPLFTVTRAPHPLATFLTIFFKPTQGRSGSANLRIRVVSLNGVPGCLLVRSGWCWFVLEESAAAAFCGSAAFRGFHDPCRASTGGCNH